MTQEEVIDGIKELEKEEKELEEELNKKKNLIWEQKWELKEKCNHYYKDGSSAFEREIYGGIRKCQICRELNHEDCREAMREFGGRF